MTIDQHLETYGCQPSCGHYQEIRELQQLRTLINAWADTMDGLADGYTDEGYARYESSVTALFRSVGR